MNPAQEPGDKKIGYSEQFKTRIVSKLVGPEALSANAISGEVGISQGTLSRWLREAGTVPGYGKEQHPRKDTTVDKPPQDWSVEERLRVVVEAAARGPFKDLEAAQTGVPDFVIWYNRTYDAACKRHPERWSGETRPRGREEHVTLNTARDKAGA